jgi:hypothetical protein
MQNDVFSWREVDAYPLAFLGSADLNHWADLLNMSLLNDIIEALQQDSLYNQRLSKFFGHLSLIKYFKFHITCVRLRWCSLRNCLGMRGVMRVTYIQLPSIPPRPTTFHKKKRKQKDSVLQSRGSTGRAKTDHNYYRVAVSSVILRQRIAVWLHDKNVLYDWTRGPVMKLLSPLVDKEFHSCMQPKGLLTCSPEYATGRCSEPDIFWRMLSSEIWWRRVVLTTTTWRHRISEDSIL